MPRTPPAPAHLQTLRSLRARRAGLLHEPPAVAAAVQAWRSEGGHLALVGPSGAGRTHLLDALARQLMEAEVCWIRVQDPSGQPWRAIEWALRDPRLPGPAEALPRHPDAGRRAQAAAAALSRRGPHPIHVLIDDVHRLDPPSLRAFAELARADGVRIACAGVAAPPWAAATCRLPRWSPAATRRLARGLLDRPVTAALAQELSQRADGRPGRVVAVLEAALQGNHLDLEEGGRRAECAALPRAPGSQTRALVAPLSHQALRIGHLLATAPIPLDSTVLPRLLDLGEEACANGLRELDAQALLREEGGQVTCRDPAAKGALRAAPEARTALHRRVVLLLDELDAPRAWLAEHLLGAADPSLAARLGWASLADLATRSPAAAADLADPLWTLARCAAVASVGVSALAAADRSGEALSLGERAVAHHGRLGGANERVPFARLLAEMARLHGDRLGDAGAARRALREARRRLAGLPPPLGLLEVEAGLHHQAGHHAQAISVARQRPTCPAADDPLDRASWLRLRLTEARAMAVSDRLDAALALLNDVPADAHIDEREALLVEQGDLAWRAGQYLTAGDAYARACDTDPTTAGLGKVLWQDRSATSYYHGGDRSHAVKTWRAALVLAQRADATLDGSRIQATLCSVLREVCRFEEAARYGQEAFDVALRAEAIPHALNAAMAMADLRLATGAHEDAAGWLERCAPLSGGPEQARSRGRLARRRAELAVRRGEADAARAVAEAIRAANRSELTRDACRATALKAVLLARDGRHEQVAPTLRRATDPLIKRGAARTLAEVRLWAAQAHLEGGRYAEAIDEAAHAVVWADEVGHLLFRNRGDDLTARARAQARRLDATSPDASDLESLLEVAVALGRERQLSTLLDQIADATMKLVDADRAFVILAAEAEGDPPRVVAARARDDLDTGRPSRSVIQTALTRGREVIVSNVRERGDLRTQESIVHLRLQSAWAIPLTEGDRTLGVLYADSRVVTQAELSRVTRLLRGLAGQAAVAVTNARLLEESQARAERAADIAHDIRSPLASVSMAMQQLSQLDELPDWTIETMQLVDEQVQHVMGMAVRFLEDRPSQLRPFDLAARAARIAGLAARDARHLGRTVVFESSGPATVLAEAEELDRALTNLLTNALQHTPEGTTVEVRVRSDAEHAVVTVHDHGPGIPQEIMDHLFERGKRGERTGGFGLGLHIARRIVESAGGTLSAHNDPTDGGATFSVSIPLQRRSHGEESSARA